MHDSVNKDVSPIEAFAQRVSNRYFAPEERLIGLGHVIIGTKFAWVVLLWYLGAYSLTALSALVSGELNIFLHDYQTPGLGLLLALALCIDHLIGNHIRAGTRKIAEYRSGVEPDHSLDWLEASVLRTIFDRRTRTACGILAGVIAVLSLLLHLQIWYKSGIMVGLFTFLFFVGGFFVGAALCGGVLTSVAIRKLARAPELRMNIYYPFEAKTCVSWSLQVALGFTILGSVAYVLLAWVPWPLLWVNQELLGYSVLIVVLCFSLIVFIVPVFSFHQRLAEDKERLLLILGNEEREAYGRTLAALQLRSTADNNHATLEREARRLEVIGNLRLSPHRISTWPLDIDSIGRLILNTIATPLVVVILTKVIGRLIS